MTRRSRPLQVDVTDADRADIRALGDELWDMQFDRARDIARRPVDEKDELKRYRAEREKADALKMQLHVIRELAACRAEAILQKGHNTKDEVDEKERLIADARAALEASHG